MSNLIDFRDKYVERIPNIIIYLIQKYIDNKMCIHPNIFKSKYLKFKDIRQNYTLKYNFGAVKGNKNFIYFSMPFNFSPNFHCSNDEYKHTDLNTFLREKFILDDIPKEISKLPKIIIFTECNFNIIFDRVSINLLFL